MCTIQRCYQYHFSVFISGKHSYTTNTVNCTSYRGRAHGRQESHQGESDARCVHHSRATKNEVDVVTILFCGRIVYFWQSVLFKVVVCEMSYLRAH